MRDVDGQRQPIVTLLLLDRCADARVHHHADRTVERVEEKAHILDQPHNLALLLGSRRLLLLLLQELFNVLLGPADVQIMFNDIVGRADAILFIVQPKQAARMPLGQTRAANQLHVLLGQA